LFFESNFIQNPYYSIFTLLSFFSLWYIQWHIFLLFNFFCPFRYIYWICFVCNVRTALYTTSKNTNFYVNSIIFMCSLWFFCVICFFVLFFVLFCFVVFICCWLGMVLLLFLISYFLLISILNSSLYKNTFFYFLT